MTIFMALSMLLFLTFCLVLTEGVRNRFLRVKAEQAIELTEFSVLSEYQYEFLKDYGVFFLDLDYEQGAERTALLEQKMERYFLKNAGEIEIVHITAENFRRATDHGGIPFLKQAAEYMKVKTGGKFFEELTGISLNLGESTDLGKILEESTGEASGIINGYVDEEGDPLFEISLPEVSFPSVNVLTEAVFGSTGSLSDRNIELSERIQNRTLRKGADEKESVGAVEMQLFHAYMFDHLNHYGAQKSDVNTASLEYQLEYVIAGESGDRKNIENIMWRIFLMRAGGDYLLLHQDSGAMAQAEGEARILVGFTLNEALVGLVRELLLISKAIDMGIDETKSIFAGEKVPLYEEGAFAGISLGYEQYLYLFLNTMEQSSKIYRCMDIIELEVREKCGYANLRMDHCVDKFEVEWTWRFESIFAWIPFLEGGKYENTIRRKFYYER